MANVQERNNAARGPAGGAEGRARPTGQVHPAARQQALLTPGQTEGVILRMAGVLSADMAGHPQVRAKHLAYVTGALHLAVALGALTDARAVAVRQAAVDLFDGAPRSGSVRAGAADPAFAALVATVRRNGGASMNEPLPLAELPPSKAAHMLARLIASGVVDGGDVTGFHRATKGDC
ncbi:hypothetical protein [Luteibacter mycovicinus]|uniref:hypothetical protein n=1 Tax=Luteibacter mycovicinus TaxID=1500890 RepID=UPI000569AABB|nr:hypothetical protein [Luteibacter sp. 9143a]